MIGVVGYALIDLVLDASGVVSARPGGAPFNTARTIGRLGQPCVFAGRLAGDGFGRMLRDGLARDGVVVGDTEPAAEPTTLAVADVDAAGAATYRFYLTGTSAAALTAVELPPGITAVHAGTLGPAMEPADSTIGRFVGESVPSDVLVMVDPNWRPAAVGSAGEFRARLFGMFRRADVVKVSVEDLDYLGVPAASLLSCGPSLVLVTDGPRPVRALLPSGELEVPVPAVPVVDTIGAGDAFGGAFLSWWTSRKLTRTDLDRADPVREALRAAVEVAAFTCTRVGADPPALADLTGGPGESHWRGTGAG